MEYGEEPRGRRDGAGSSPRRRPRDTGSRRTSGHRPHDAQRRRRQTGRRLSPEERRARNAQLTPEERTRRREIARRKARQREQQRRRAWLVLIGAGVLLILLIVLVVNGIASCARGAANSPQTQQVASTATAPAATTSATTTPAATTSATTGSTTTPTATTGSATSAATTTPASPTQAVSPSVPDPAWKQAAGVPDLTKQGTDPTRIAAEKQAERESANLAHGYRGVEDSWVKGGYFTTGDQELDEMVKAFCDKHSTAGNTAAQNAQNVFNNITWSDYVEWEGNQYPHVYDWQVAYAKDFFERGGNCFSMASAIQWCMRYFGYSDAHAELTYQERQSGGWLDHGLTWLTDVETGEIHMIDSEQASKGWMMKPHAYNVEILDPTSDWEPRSSAFNVQRN